MTKIQLIDTPDLQIERVLIDCHQTYYSVSNRFFISEFEITSFLNLTDTLNILCSDCDN